MKQNITALIIFITIITISLLSLNYTDTICTKINNGQILCEVHVLNGDWKSAVNQMTTTKELWDKYHPKLAILLNHRDLDEINDLITSANAFAILNDKSNFIEKNKRLMALVDNLKKKDILTFENLF